MKKAVNDRLTALTGYRLTRAQPKHATDGGAPAQPPKPPPTPAEESAPAKERKPKENGKPAELPLDYDDPAKEIIASVRPYTMTAPDKLFGLIEATRYVTRHRIEGDIVECGVWRGGSMQAAAKTLLAEGDTTRDIYLFDTYEGMPPPTEEDQRHDGTPAAELLAIRPRTHDVWAVADLDDVREGFAQVPYPRERVHFVKGLVEETVPDQAPERIAILRLDTDWYESTRHELEHLYPRLVPGGVLIIDDYGWWKGARQAVDEFVAATDDRLLLVRLASGRIAVKQTA